MPGCAVISFLLGHGRLFPGQPYTCEGLNLAARRVVDRPLPSVGILAVGESCVDAAAVIASEPECHGVTASLRATNRLGCEVPRASIVKPQTGVLARLSIPADEDNRFIRGLVLGVLLSGHFLDTHILMTQYPLRHDVVRGILPSDGALKHPLSDHVIEQGILKRGWLGQCGERNQDT